MNQETQEQEKKCGPFVAFVLLEQPNWDIKKLQADLLADWGIQCGPNDADPTGETLVFEQENCMLTAGLMKAPVPDQEAEHNAQNNYLWREAVAQTSKHQAHIMAAVLPLGQGPVQAATLLTKLVYSCCKQQGALGIYTTGTVFEPSFYMQEAELLHAGELPLLDWVYLGLYPGEKGFCGYTYGLTAFGKTEIEVLNANAQPAEMLGFLADIINYVIGYDAVLQDGETIGFSEEQKLPITLSDGVALDGQTLKIGYPEE